MKANEQQQAILLKLEEIRTIEDHLHSIRQEYREQQEQITALEQVLEDQYRNFRLFDSEISRILLGEHSSERMWKVNRSKEEFLNAALKLSDYERISSSLRELEVTLHSKLEKKKDIVQRLLNYSREEQTSFSGMEHPDSELLEQYAQAIEGKLGFITLFLQSDRRGSWKFCLGSVKRINSSQINCRRLEGRGNALFATVHFHYHRRAGE